jgi:hypothetical protein
MLKFHSFASYLSSTILDHTMTTPILRLFSYFSLQWGSEEVLHHRTQLIVWYAESRFRQALIKISQADIRRQKWLQIYLKEEVVGL